MGPSAAIPHSGSRYLVRANLRAAPARHGYSRSADCVPLPWQNAYVERLIGSIRRECLDHVIIFDAHHLRGVLSSHFQYHHNTRTHLSLDKDCPQTRPLHPPTAGKIIAFPVVRGLHHRYERRAA